MKHSPTRGQEWGEQQLEIDESCNRRVVRDVPGQLVRTNREALRELLLKPWCSHKETGHERDNRRQPKVSVQRSIRMKPF